MRQSVYKRLEALERIHAAARQAKAHRTRLSGTEVMSALLSQYAIVQQPGESRVETLARATGISTRELKDLFWEHAQTAAPELVVTGQRLSSGRRATSR
jgi:hypothetical protein